MSVDPETGDTAMISFPRDIARFEQPDGTTFNRKINALMTYADNHPDEYPQGGIQALMDDSATCSASRSSTTRPSTSRASPG